jgi:hypothetical protein
VPITQSTMRGWGSVQVDDVAVAPLADCSSVNRFCGQKYL